MATSAFLAELGVEPESSVLSSERQALLDLAQAKSFPGIYKHGEYWASGERAWKVFCERAHPDWLPYAKAGLDRYDV